jgi:cell wall assembly regulator SMI1
MTRWEKPYDLHDVLRQLAGASEPRVTAEPKGYTAEEIASREQEMGWPIPPDVRELYLRFTPQFWKTAVSHVSGETQFPEEPYFTDPYLMPLQNAGWRSNGQDITELRKFAPEMFAKPAPTWESVIGFAFAATDQGEEIVYCPNPPEQNPGLIVCWYGMTFPRGVHLGSSLSQWLARFYTCGCREYAFANIDPTEEEKEFDGERGLDEPLRSAFLLDHLRLNPNDDHARRLLAQTR